MRFFYILFFILVSRVLCSQEESSSHRGSFTLYGDFLYLKREHVTRKPLVANLEKPDNPTVIDSKNLLHDFSFEPGFRVGVWWDCSPRSSLEGSYDWLNRYLGSKEVEETDSLFFPFQDLDYTEDLFAADRATARYRSSFQAAEFNYWRHITPRFGDYFSFSTLVGLRFFYLGELNRVSFFKHRLLLDREDRSDYRISTSNWLGGLQVGANLQVMPYSFMYWELTPKAGLLCNRGEQTTFLGDQNNQVVLRDFNESDYQLSYAASARAAIHFLPLTFLDIQGGYEFLYLGNVALAPEQISYKVSSNSGKKLKMKGYIILQGAFVGLGFSF